MQPNINQTTTKSSMRLRHWHDTLGLVSAVGLVWLIICLLLPVTYDDIKAEESSPYTTQPTTIALVVGEAAAIDITPTATGQFGKTTAQVNVTTNSNAGYKLYLNTADYTNAMYSVNSNSTAEISAVNGTISEAEFLANEWGYGLTSGADNTLQYQAMPLTATMVEESPETTGSYDLNFGAMVDTALPAGQYVNNVLVSAVANPSYVTGLMSLTYIQDMTTSTCADTKGTDGSSNQDASGSYIITPGNEPTKQLIDIRDGKEYWVAKLADGNCWMVQNLALDLSTNKALTNADTDLNSKSTWTPTANTSKTLTADATGATVNSALSLNLGEVVIATPTRGIVCQTMGISDKNANKSIVAGQNLTQSCTDFVDVNDQKWTPTFNAIVDGINQTWSGTNYNPDTKKIETYTYDTASDGGIVALNRSDFSYDAHYLIGNYYQFNAATAGSGSDQVYSPDSSATNANSLVDAKDSICPKGWRLPASGNNTITNIPFDRNKSFAKLLTNYGYSMMAIRLPVLKGAYLSGVYQPPYNGTFYAVTGNTNTAYQNPVLAPIYYTNSGYARLAPKPENTDISYAGSWTTLRSSTTQTKNWANYDMFLQKDDIIPSAGNYRVHLTSVRCLAR